MSITVTTKKALIILTNEAFLTQSQRKQSFLKSIPNPFSSSPAAEPGPIEDFVQTHRNTGVDIVELGYLWTILLRQLDMDLTFVSPKGGPVALDPNSVNVMNSDHDLRERLKDERDFMVKMSHTYPIDWVNPEEYSIVIIPGCHGAMLDLPECSNVNKCIAKIYENGGLVCAIGHGCSALINVRISRTTSANPAGDYLVKGKRITCFSNAEEKEANFEGFLPYRLEEKLKEHGAKVEVQSSFTPFVVEAENLITAQSWPSAQKFVQKIAEKFKAQQ